ncbi:MAG: hypothetical protein ACXWC6_10350 [Ramlibacter sp.]
MSRLTAEMTEFLAQGVAHQLGACDAQGWPHICRGLAADVEPDGRVVVLLSGASGFELLPAIRASRHVSAVFVKPQTFRALHLKGRDAEVFAAGAAWRPLLERRRAAFDAQLLPFGFSPENTSAWYSVPDAELLGVRFTPYGGWNQTPGPGAGAPVALA